MFNFNRCAVEELHSMEIALLGTGDVTLNAVAAEYKMLWDLGYIAMENEAFVKGRPLPAAFPAYDHVLINGLFYKENEIPTISVPPVTAYAVVESLHYLSFESSKVTGKKRNRIYDFARNVTASENQYAIFALGEEKKYRELNPEEDFSEFEDILEALVPILTPTLDVIEKDASWEEHIDWNYLLYRNEEYEANNEQRA